MTDTMVTIREYAKAHGLTYRAVNLTARGGKFKTLEIRNGERYVDINEPYPASRPREPYIIPDQVITMVGKVYHMCRIAAGIDDELIPAHHPTAIIEGLKDAIKIFHECENPINREETERACREVMALLPKEPVSYTLTRTRIYLWWIGYNSVKCTNNTSEK